MAEIFDLENTPQLLTGSNQHLFDIFLRNSMCHNSAIIPLIALIYESFWIGLWNSLQLWDWHPAIRDQRSHDHDQRKTQSQIRSRIAEISPFWQITIARKTLHFLKKTVQFLIIANCRNGPLSANHDRKKYFTISQKNYTISCDRELQKWATFCKSLRKKNFTISQEKLYNFP